MVLGVNTPPFLTPPNVPYLSDLRYGIYGKLEGGLQNHMVNRGRSPKSGNRFLRPPPNLPYREGGGHARPPVTGIPSVLTSAKHESSVIKININKQICSSLDNIQSLLKLPNC